MSEPRCLASETLLESGYRAVVLENEILSVTVLPEKGADIYSLVYKPRSMDILWKSPWGLKPLDRAIASGGSSEETWLEHYEGGWQEIFPNGGNACVYKGCRLNFHGEASLLSWNCSLERHPDWVAAESTVSTFRSPFSLKRKMLVEAGRPVVRISEKIVNHAEEEMHFMWGHHPALGKPFLGDSCWIQLPTARFQAHSTEYAPTCRIPAGTVAPWPMVPGKEGAVDLSQVPPESQRVYEYGYITDLDQGWYAITSRQHDFSFGMVWPLRVFPFLWLWQELRGSFGHPWYGRAYVMAMEPFTSIPGTGLADAIAAGNAPVLPPGGSIEAELAAWFIEGQSRIETLDRNEVRLVK
ncbi:MAG: DUF4432 family protein [Acidobacteriota bacterium]